MGGKEETVGYFAVGHSFDDTDNDFLFAGTQCLLFIAIPFAVFAFGMQALQFELHFVCTVEYADLVVIIPDNGMFGYGIEQGQAFHIRATRHLLQVRDSEVTRDGRIDDEDIRMVCPEVLRKRFDSRYF